AATSYNQTSRKSANKNVTARNNTRSEQVKSTSQNRSTATSRSTSNAVSANKHVTANNSSRPAQAKAIPQDRSKTTSRATTTQNNNKPTTHVSTDRNARTSEPAKQTPTARPTSRSTNDHNRTAAPATKTPSHTNTGNKPRSTSSAYDRSSTTTHHSSTQYTPTRRSQPASTRNVVTYNSPRAYHQKHTVHHHYHTPPPSVEYRRVHTVYRAPVNVHFYWTPTMHRHFIEIYPMVNHWKYHNGYHIQSISAYDAMYYRGEVMTVYGLVSDVYYSRNTDEYYLYYGPYYPYQDFTVVIPGYLARMYSRNPASFFTNRYLAITGLITTYDGEPEIVVRKDFQISLY
ncbi:MAG: hypothetical protein JW801_00050, partial [Bacteroidales bacterium]|nr:hypothetical protein [Bacteroidales bacterium]